MPLLRSVVKKLLFCSVAQTCNAIAMCLARGDLCTPHTQGAALLYNSFMKDFLANSDGVNAIPGETKVEVRIPLSVFDNFHRYTTNERGFAVRGEGVSSGTTDGRCRAGLYPPNHA